MTGLSDSFQRPINYLRISVTDRCNLRCVYCMPEEGVSLMSHSDILSYEEIYRVVEAAAEMGIDRVRLTGGEPLVRAGVSDLVKLIAGIDTINDIALTTNGILLSQYAAELKDAGLRRVNISLDTLKPERFNRITRCGNLEDALKGIEAAHAAGLDPVKVAQIGLEGFAQQILDHGYFHADPHPGNSLAMVNGKIGLIDFGIMGFIDQELMRNLANIFVGYAEHDYDRVITVFISMGLISEKTDLKNFKYDLMDLSEPFYGRSLEHIQIKDVFDKITTGIADNKG